MSRLTEIKKKLRGRGFTKIPSKIKPMLCTLVKDVPVDSDFIYEIKWDGYRIITFFDGSILRMESRSGLDYTSKYPFVVSGLQKLKYKFVMDGEMVVFDEQGLPDFNAIQSYDGLQTSISYCVFDLLWLDGQSLQELHLHERKAILKNIIGKTTVLKFSESFEDGAGLYLQMRKLGLEGIIAKKKDSAYHEGERAYNWLKIPIKKRQEFVIGGWAESEKNRAFKSLLFGAYKDGEFRWIGRSGGGYKIKEMPGVLAKLKKLEIPGSPFVNPVLDTKGALTHWTKPKLVGLFEFSTWTKNGRIRKPATFLGFRKDKRAEDVILEIPKSGYEINMELKKPGKLKRKVRQRKQANATATG